MQKSMNISIKALRHHLRPSLAKKGRTFTDYPVTDEPIASKVSTSNSARGSDDRDVDLRVKIDKISDAKTKTSDKDQKTDNKDMVVYNEKTGMYQRTEKGLSSERIVKKLSKSPSPPQKRRSMLDLNAGPPRRSSRSPRRSSRSPKRSSRSPNRSRSARKSRSRSRSRDRHPRQSRDRRDHKRSRSRSRDRQNKRSRSRDRSPRGRRSSRSPGRGRSSGRRPRSLERSPRRSPVGLTIGRDQFGRDNKRSSRSPQSRKRSRSPQSRRDSPTPPHKKVLKEYSSSKRKSDGGELKGTNLDSWKKETVEDLISETDKMRKEREKIKKEKEKLVSGGDLQS